VIDEAQPHGRSRRRAGHVGIGKANSMKLRVAVLYGGRSGEHEVSINSRKPSCSGWTQLNTR